MRALQPMPRAPLTCHARPKSLRTSVRRSHPARIAVPAHNAAPAPDAARKLVIGNLSDPAIGGPTVEKPGTNFAPTKDHAPHRTKSDSAEETHNPGFSDNLHNPARMRYPNARPAAYQSRSASIEARTATASSWHNWPYESARLPATRSVATAGPVSPTAGAVRWRTPPRRHQPLRPQQRR